MRCCAGSADPTTAIITTSTELHCPIFSMKRSFFIFLPNKKNISRDKSEIKYISFLFYGVSVLQRTTTDNTRAFFRGGGEKKGQMFAFLPDHT